MPLPRLACPLLIALTLAGCAGAPPEPRPWAEVATRELQLALDSIEVQGRRVAITRSARAEAATPVVVYLPGLGEGSEAGQGGGPLGGGTRAPRSGSATEAAQTDLGEGLSRSRLFLDTWVRNPG